MLTCSKYRIVSLYQNIILSAIRKMNRRKKHTSKSVIKYITSLSRLNTRHCQHLHILDELAGEVEHLRSGANWLRQHVHGIVVDAQVVAAVIAERVVGARIHVEHAGGYTI